MSRISEIFNYMRQCPELYDLFSIAGTEDVGNTVILPQGASERYMHAAERDVTGCVIVRAKPNVVVWEDYQINLFKDYQPLDASAPDYNSNVLSFDDAQRVCDWINEQNSIDNLPELSDVTVVGIETNPFVPQVQYVNSQEGIIAYFITVRIRYINTDKDIYREYEN